MGIEHFEPECGPDIDPESRTDFVLLVGGTLLAKSTGESLEVVTDDEGVKYFRFLYDPEEKPNSMYDPHESRVSAGYREKYPSWMIVRADQVVGIVQQRLPRAEDLNGSGLHSG